MQRDGRASPFESLVWRHDNHLSTIYARWLVPVVAEALQRGAGPTRVAAPATAVVLRPAHALPAP